MRLIDADALREEEGLFATLVLDAAPTVSCEECRYMKRHQLQGPYCCLDHTDDIDGFGCSDFERREP